MKFVTVFTVLTDDPNEVPRLRTCLLKMPEAERDPGPDPEEDVAWDGEADLPMWQDGADDAGISGTRDVDC